MQRLVTSMGKKAWGWSDGQRPRQALVLAGRAGPRRAARLGLVAVGPVPPGPADRRRHARERVPHRERPGRHGPPGRARARAAAARAGPPPRGRADPARRPDRGAPGALRRQRRRQGRQADDPRQPGRARRPQGAGARPAAAGSPAGGARRARAGAATAPPAGSSDAPPRRPGRPPSSRSSSRRAGRGRLAGARDQHHRRRDRLRRRVLAGHGQGRRGRHERELRLRARQLQGVHDAGGLLPARARRRPERQDHADQRRRGAQPQLPGVHHDRDRQAARDLRQLRAVGGAAPAAHRGAAEARRDRHLRPARRGPQRRSTRSATRSTRRSTRAGSPTRRRPPTPTPDGDPGQDRHAGGERDPAGLGDHADADAARRRRRRRTPTDRDADRDATRSDA